MSRVERELRDCKKIIATQSSVITHMDVSLAMMEGEIDDHLRFLKSMDYKPNSKLQSLKHQIQAARAFARKERAALMEELQSSVVAERLDTFCGMGGLEE
jgi:hypothetical protein